MISFPFSDARQDNQFNLACSLIQSREQTVSDPNEILNRHLVSSSLAFALRFETKGDGVGEIDLGWSGEGSG